MKTRIIFLWIVCFVLTSLPLGILTPFKPLWILLFILYLQFKLPNVFNLFWIMISGLLLDVLSGMPLGAHVFCLCLVTWCASTRARRFKFFSMPQQWVWISLLSALYQFLIAFLAYIGGYSHNLMSLGLPILTSVLIWPVMLKMFAIIQKNNSQITKVNHIYS